MELLNEFKVNVPLEQSWSLLTDPIKIVPCLPGAVLDEIIENEYRGTVKVKVGPITATYKGSASFVKLDYDSGIAVIRAEGRQTKNQGNASATITLHFVEIDNSTEISVSTSLTITGKVASLGRGMIADVSKKLVTQFVDALEELIQSEGGILDSLLDSDQTTELAKDSKEASDDVVEKAPIDLISTVEASTVKRIATGIGATVFFLAYVFFRRHKARGAK